MTTRLAAILAVALAATSLASAEVLRQDESEINFAFSYNDLDPDGFGTDIKTTTLAGSYGYMLTDGHEIGGRLSYLKTEVGDADVDSTQLGAFYQYNFRGGEMLNPYLGGTFSFFAGDLGDFYDYAYGVEGGLKVWPWQNAGFNFGLSWEELTGADDFEDASSMTLFGGIGIKF